MLENPLVLGVTQVTSLHGVTLEQIMSKLGRNSGNILFTEAICRAITNATLSHYDLGPQMLEGRDSIVIAAANWLGSDQDFSWLADELEKTKLPVFAIGLGAQATLQHDIPKLRPGTLKLLDILNERSELISVRGEFTRRVLEHYGIDKGLVTG